MHLLLQKEASLCASSSLGQAHHRSNVYQWQVTCSGQFYSANECVDPMHIIQELVLRFGRMEQVLTKHGLMLNAICERQLINTAIIPGFNNPVLPPLPSATNSPAGPSASSPGLAVAALALSDTHSNASSRSSGKSSDKPGKSDASLPIEPYSLLMQLGPLESPVGTVPSPSGRVHARQVVAKRHEGCLGLFLLIMYNTTTLFFVNGH